jgi:DNA-binding response OmpR family regulator
MTQSHARVLIVDDERNIRKTLSLVLEAEGYEVDVASDGASALAKARERHYDIAFVDLHMPLMGGLDLTRSLRAFSEATAIVILTAYGSVSHAVAAMKLGAVDFLEKPFDPKNIRLLVEEILLRQRLGSGGSVEELLHLATLARERNAHVEARMYLKSAMLRDAARPEPFYWLGYLCEIEGDIRQAVHYYYLAVEVDHAFQPALESLTRLGRERPKTQT